jgi:hypothetical protein
MLLIIGVQAKFNAFVYLEWSGRMFHVDFNVELSVVSFNVNINHSTIRKSLWRKQVLRWSRKWSMSECPPICNYPKYLCILSLKQFWQRDTLLTDGPHVAFSAEVVHHPWGRESNHWKITAPTGSLTTNLIFPSSGSTWPSFIVTPLSQKKQTYAPNLIF